MFGIVAHTLVCREVSYTDVVLLFEFVQLACVLRGWMLPYDSWLYNWGSPTSTLSRMLSMKVGWHDTTATLAYWCSTFKDTCIEHCSGPVVWYSFKVTLELLKINEMFLWIGIYMCGMHGWRLSCNYTTQFRQICLRVKERNTHSVIPWGEHVIAFAPL